MREFVPVLREISPEDAKKFALQNALRDRALKAGVRDGHVFGILSITAAENVDAMTILVKKMELYEKKLQQDPEFNNLLSYKFQINKIRHKLLVAFMDKADEVYTDSEKLGAITENLFQIFLG